MPKIITCQDTSKSSLCNNKMLSAFTNHKHVDWKSVQESQFLIFNFILIAYFDHRAYDQLKQNVTAAGRRHNSEGCYRQDLSWPQGQRSNHDGHTLTHTNINFEINDHLHAGSYDHSIHWQQSLNTH